MVTVTQIVTEAYRESNITPIGQVPSAIELAEGVLIFNRLVRSVFGNEAGDPYTDIAIGNNNVNAVVTKNYDTVSTSSWYPPINSRIIFNNTTTQQVSLNPYPQDGERFCLQDASSNFATYPVTLLGNGRTIDGSVSVVLNTNGYSNEWFYRSDVHDWRSIGDLTSASDLPFPIEFEDLFIIGLAIRLNPRFGTQLDPLSIETYKRLLSKFKSRYAVSTEQRSEEALLRTPGTRYQYSMNFGRNIETTQLFNTGSV